MDEHVAAGRRRHRQDGEQDHRGQVGPARQRVCREGGPGELVRVPGRYVSGAQPLAQVRVPGVVLGDGVLADDDSTAHKVPHGDQGKDQEQEPRGEVFVAFGGRELRRDHVSAIRINVWSALGVLARQRRVADVEDRTASTFCSPPLEVLVLVIVPPRG